MSEKNKEKRIDSLLGLLFVSLMFIGTGLGLLLGRPDVGATVGMGIGFLLMGIVRIKVKDIKPIEIIIPKFLGAIILALTGICFIIVGISLYTLQTKLISEILLPYFGGTITILIGLVFILGALTLFKTK